MVEFNGGDEAYLICWSSVIHHLSIRWIYKYIFMQIDTFPINI